MTDEQIKKLAKQLAEELLKQLEIKQLDELFTES